MKDNRPSGLLRVDTISEVRYSIHVKTTIDIPDAELRDAMRFLRAKTKRQAVVTALQELNRRHRMAKLVDYSATCDFPTNADLEVAESAEESGKSPAEHDGAARG